MEIITLQYWEFLYVPLNTIFLSIVNLCTRVTKGMKLWLEAFVKASQQV